MSANGSTVLVNGVEFSSISVSDRGLAYGDGLFETLRVRDKKIPLWSYHQGRLESGCQRLGIKLDLKTLESELQQLLDGIGRPGYPATRDQLIKIIVTRGPGQRGYSPEGANNPTRILFHSEYSAAGPDYYQSGVAVRICSTPLALNPSLAGIKHLNRLEQVLARSEWSGSDYAEGLMCDIQGAAVDGTMSNFIVVKNGQLYAPELSQAGVEGVMRRYIFEHANSLGLIFHIKKLTLDELFSADEIFICNSVFGVWPLRSLIDDTDEYSRQRQWSTEFPVAKALQSSIELKLFPQ
jgi:4-amino-4-deoxychorismate lyase